MQPVQTNLIGASALTPDEETVIIAAVAIDDRGKFKILVIGEDATLSQQNPGNLKIHEMAEARR